MRNTKVRAIVDTAVAAAICALFIVIVVYVPPLAVLFSFAVGTPLMYISFKRGWQYAILATVCSFFVGFIFVGDILSLGLIVLMYAVPGLVFGICASKKLKFSISVMLSAISVLVGFVIELMLVNGGGDGIENMLVGITDNMEQTLKDTLTQMGGTADKEINAVFSQLLGRFVDMIMLYIPSFSILGAVVYAYIISMIGVFLLKRLGIKDIEYTKFYMIKVPKGVCIASVILFVICNLVEDGGIYVSALENMLFILVSAVIVNGLATVDYKLRKSIRNGYLRAILYIAIFLFASMLSSMLISILTIVGFIDGMGKGRLPEKVGDENENK